MKTQNKKQTKTKQKQQQQQTNKQELQKQQKKQHQHSSMITIVNTYFFLKSVFSVLIYLMYTTMLK